MSENTTNGALRRLGYTGSEMTAHGFRSTASTLLNESGQYWNERVEMVQWWSDYLDVLQEGAKILPFDHLRQRSASR